MEIGPLPGTQSGFRVSTTRVHLPLEMDEGPQIRWRWHPEGNSLERRPHIHPSFNLKAPLLPGSHTACAGRNERLLEAGGVHKVYRTWVDGLWSSVGHDEPCLSKLAHRSSIKAEAELAFERNQCLTCRSPTHG